MQRALVFAFVLAGPLLALVAPPAAILTGLAVALLTAPVALPVALSATALLLVAAGAAAGQPTESRHETSAGPVVVTAVGPAFSHPWSVAFLPDFPLTGALLVTERAGRLILLDAAGDRPVEGLPEITAGGQGGLFDVTPSPDFADTGLLFLAHAAPVTDGVNTVVTRATLDRSDPERPRLADLERIFAAEPGARGGRHFGGRLVVDREGALMLTTGDRGDPDTSQDPFHANGKVHRFLADGSIPDDNPFIDGDEALETVWSLGHRNAQGAARHPDSGVLWTVEHGPRGGDEINRPEAGENYGWPVISYGRHYSGARVGVGTEKPGLMQPLFYWDPSIAPSGAAFVTGEQFADWSGDLLVGALRDRAIVRLEVDGDSVTEVETLFEGAFGRIRDVRIGPDGALWFLTDESDARLWRAVPAAD